MISAEFEIGASVIVFFWTQTRRSLCYTEVAKCSLNSLTSVGRCCGKILHPQKLLKICVTFHPNLTFCDHIIKTFSSCMSSLSQISRVTHMFGRNTLIRVVNSLVFRKLFYRSSVWSNAATTHILKLQAVQNFASRMISNTRKFDNVTPILKDLRWFPVKYQLYYRHAVLAFHCMTGLKPLILPYFS